MLLSKEFQSRLQEMAEKYSIALLVLDRDSQVVITTSGYSELLTERLWKRVLEGKVSSQGESKYRIEEGRDTKNGPVYMECWGFLGNGTIFESIHGGNCLRCRFFLHGAFLFFLLPIYQTGERTHQDFRTDEEFGL